MRHDTKLDFFTFISQHIQGPQTVPISYGCLHALHPIISYPKRGTNASNKGLSYLPLKVSGSLPIDFKES